MKDSKALMLEYLASIRDPERAAALFAGDGVFELPFLRSLGVKPNRDAGKDVCRVRGARARRCDGAHGPSSVHWVPGG